MVDAQRNDDPGYALDNDPGHALGHLFAKGKNDAGEKRFPAGMTREVGNDAHGR